MPATGYSLIGSCVFGLPLLAYLIWRLCRSPWKSGIGASFSILGSGLYSQWIVSELLPGGALDRAGIKLGAAVLTIDGVSTANISRAQMRALIRQSLGTHTSMTFRTGNDEVRTVSLVYELEQRFGSKGVLYEPRQASGYLDSTRVNHGVTVSHTRNVKYPGGRLTDEAIDSSL